MSSFKEPTNDELWAQPPTLLAASAPANLPVPTPPPALPQPVATSPLSRGGLALAITSLGIGIPLSAIAGGTAGLAGLVVAWIGIVGVNVAFAWSQRKL